MRPLLLASPRRTRSSRTRTICATRSTTRSSRASSRPPTRRSSRAPSTTRSHGSTPRKRARRRSTRRSRRSSRRSPTPSCRSCTALLAVPPADSLAARPAAVLPAASPVHLRTAPASRRSTNRLRFLVHARFASHALFFSPIIILRGPRLT